MRGAVSTGAQFFDYLREAFDYLYAEGATHPRMMSAGLHCRIAGHPGRASGVRRFLEHVLQHTDVWICRREQVADHWREHHTPA